jgi:MFS family permease
MITWVWAHDARKQRINVAILNAMFTIGAFVTPMLIAASMHHMQGSVWPAYYMLAAAAIVEAGLLSQLPSPNAARSPDAGHGGGAARKKVAGVSPAKEVELAELGEGRGAHASPGRDDVDDDLLAAEHTRLVASPDPGTVSKAKGRATDLLSPPGVTPASWCYLGDPEVEAVLPRYVVCMVAICTLCFFANGCEHAVATWLSAFGVKQRHLGEESMAIMTSNFWTAMSVGRLAWACFSGFVTSAWPVLFCNTLCCVASALAMFVPSAAVLWSSAMGIGLGVSSSYPAAVTLPPEMGITMSPRMMTTLQLSASFGEMACPFLMGIAFQMRRYKYGGARACAQREPRVRVESALLPARSVRPPLPLTPPPPYPRLGVRFLPAQPFLQHDVYLGDFCPVPHRPPVVASHTAGARTQVAPACLQLVAQQVTRLASDARVVLSSSLRLPRSSRVSQYTNGKECRTESSFVCARDLKTRPL